MKRSRTVFHREQARNPALAMLASLTFGLGALTLAQQTILSAPAPVTNSVIRSIQVSPKLPLFRFILKPDIWPRNDHFWTSERIGRIEVFNGNSKALRQSIDVPGTHPSWLTNSFDSMDINMDGYQDIGVLYEVGGKWGSHSYWLFEPKSGRFITNALTADLRKLEHNGLTLNPRKREIRTSYFIGICLKSFKIHRIEKGRLALIESEMHSPIEPGRCLVEKRKRVNGELVLVKAKEQKHEVPPGL